ncbi:hypothetical protein FB45DRAFT_931580 [Roridomyces roridus]|uniref:Uncharacterized protein n=1 Tax=Roridomyces roridus TaxID=1738132 RepID=A0AAD7BEI4_9AGAR|nr:hypothetical protein FB45DRAFT_931580 [Roridomyces roridus]
MLLINTFLKLLALSAYLFLAEFPRDPATLTLASRVGEDLVSALRVIVPPPDRVACLMLAEHFGGCHWDTIDSFELPLVSISGESPAFVIVARPSQPLTDKIFAQYLAAHPDGVTRPSANSGAIPTRSPAVTPAPLPRLSVSAEADAATPTDVGSLAVTATSSSRGHPSDEGNPSSRSRGLLHLYTLFEPLRGHILVIGVVCFLSGIVLFGIARRWASASSSTHIQAPAGPAAQDAMEERIRLLLLGILGRMPHLDPTVARELEAEVALGSGIGAPLLPDTQAPPDGRPRRHALAELPLARLEQRGGTPDGSQRQLGEADDVKVVPAGEENQPPATVAPGENGVPEAAPGHETDKA